MKIHDIILEAMPPSLYRKHVKNWDRERFADLFQDPKFKTDRNAFRVYLPLKSSKKQVVNVPQEIQAALADKGYEVQDYKAGLAKEKDGKRVMKIGKLLPPALQQTFANDKSRQAQDEYVVVISRHPYDVAGMSTNRGWTSCMNLKGGINSKYVKADIKQGTVVAYLVKTSDLDIKSAVGRIAIKPFIETVTEKIVFGAEDRVYGTDAPGFKQTVKAWVDYTNSKIITDDMILAQLAPGLYTDSPATQKPLVVTKDKAMQSIIKNPMSIKDISNPSKALQLAAVKQKGHVIQFIKNPSEAVQLAAVKQNGLAIQFIKNPSEAVQLSAVKQKGLNIQFIKNPSEAVQLAVVKKDGYGLRFIKNPSEAVQLAAVKQYGWAIEFIKNPSEALQLMAVTQDGGAIQFIKNPSEAVQLTAVKKDEYVIQYIKNPSEAVQLAAVKQDGRAIRFIKNPSEAMQLAAVKQDGYAIQLIKNPSEAVQLAAVKQDGRVIRLIKNPSKAVQSAAKASLQ
jgi:hypothetical protein